jgi:predicted NUDIX family NTP pyrophosphohydrolase
VHTGLVTVHSAGILLYRFGDGQPAGQPLEVWIAHMGGPFWARKDEHAWSIPKGEFDPDHEDPLLAARREFAEEIGEAPPDADYRLLGTFRQNSGKLITAYAAEAQFEPARIESNTFSVEWPKGSGRIRDFPEIDDARWVPEAEARLKLVRGQVPMLDALIRPQD